ncbi:MAG: hypothetical protein HY344_04750 [Candidatus Levybacteria bacterium]|nr:hypothetical protein [Candidatus Levybacteria bacterium]
MNIRERSTGSEGGVATPRIDVDAFIAKYGVDNELTREVLHEFPTLCYLLGNTTDTPQAMDSRPDGVARRIFFLTEGSGMFGLSQPEDAMRWRGIFNHVMGTTRQVYYLGQRLMEIGEGGRAELGSHGFDAGTFDEIDPELMRRFFLVSHAGRRRADERAWHGLNDGVHIEDDIGEASLEFLTSQDAEQGIIDLMRVEAHSDLLDTAMTLGYFPNIVDNVLTYTDWTYGQRPQTLQSRFEGLRKSQRQPVEVLDALERAGNHFEQAIVSVLGIDTPTRMANASYDWEERIRRAYCAPSGISIAHAFPDYSAQFGITA